MHDGGTMRDGLDYVKLDGKFYVEPITTSFLAYGFTHNFLSSKMFNKFHETVEKQLHQIPKGILNEFSLRKIDTFFAELI